MTSPLLIIRTGLAVVILALVVPAAAAQTSATFTAAVQPDSAGNLLLHWPGADKKLYRIESSPDLKNWTTRPGVIAGTEGEFSTVVRATGTTDPSRQFWRVTADDAAAVVAIGGDHQVSLTWKIVAGTSFYRIKRGPSGGPYALVGTNTHPYFNDTGLTNGTPYSYVVSAVAGTTEGADSAEVTATPAVLGTELSLVASRTIGVAPLSVFFDVTPSPQFADGSYVDATCLWNFDADNLDPAAPYRTGNGFVAAHVFDQPGTYRVTVDVYDRAGVRSAQETTITVLPFTGATYYVAANGLDSNPGTIDAPWQHFSYAVGRIKTPNTRVLFRKGDTFHTNFVQNTAKGPIILGAYSAPTAPSSAKPVIYSDAVDSDWWTLVVGSDWRVMDLAFTSGGATSGRSGTPRYPGALFINTNDRHSLLYRLTEYNVSNCGMNVGGRYNTEALNEYRDCGASGFCAGGDGVAVIGNWTHDSNNNKPEHGLRIQGGTRHYVAHNIFDDRYANYDEVTIRGDTDRIVLYRNVISGMLGIWPQNRNSSNEHAHHITADSNLFLGKSGYSYNRMSAISLHSREITIRNNLFSDYSYQIVVEDDTVIGPSSDIRIYNNTAVGVSHDSDFRFVLANSVCARLDIRNNLLCDTTGLNAGHFFLSTYGGTGALAGFSDYNRFFSPGWTEAQKPLFPLGTLPVWRAATGMDLHSAIVDPLLLSLDAASADFGKLSPSSPLKDAGTRTPVAVDYFGNLRDATPDVGAFEILP